MPSLATCGRRREFNSEHVQRSKLRYEGRRWLASKALPAAISAKRDFHGVSPPEAGDRTASGRGCYRPLKVCPNARQRQGTTRRAPVHPCHRLPGGRNVAAPRRSARNSIRHDDGAVPARECPAAASRAAGAGGDALSDPTRFRLPSGGMQPHPDDQRVSPAKGSGQAGRDAVEAPAGTAPPSAAMPNNLAPESARLNSTLSKPLCPVFCIMSTWRTDDGYTDCSDLDLAEAEILPGGAKRYLFRPAEADAKDAAAREAWQRQCEQQAAEQERAAAVAERVKEGDHRPRSPSRRRSPRVPSPARWP
jgi:hypothetical protein